MKNSEHQKVWFLESLSDRFYKGILQISINKLYIMYACDEKTSLPSTCACNHML